MHLTRQEVVDKVYKFFVIEKHPKSYDEEYSVCRYRKNVCGVPTCCAIGCLLNPDIDTKPFEDTAPHVEYEKDENISKKMELLLEAMKKSNLNVETVEERKFFRDLQLVHDSIDSEEKDYFSKQFKKDLKEFCKKFDLRFPGAKE